MMDKMTLQREKQPDRHKQEITYGEENTGSFPEEVAGESEMLYSEANIAYFDIINCYDLRHNEYGGIKGDLLTKQDLIEGSIDENLIKMPCESWSDSYGIYISSKQIRRGDR